MSQATSEINTRTSAHLCVIDTIIISTNIEMPAIVIVGTICLSQTKDFCHSFETYITILPSEIIQFLSDFLRSWCEANGIFGVNSDFTKHD